MALTSPSFKKGFTLIELMVTIGVFILLSGALLGNYRVTTKSLSLNSLANLIAGDIRRAQTYGISSLDIASVQDYYYGISFDKAYPTAFMLYKSRAPNAQNDSLGPDCSGSECLENNVIKSGSRITKICGGEKSTGTCQQLDSLHVAFKRPDPEASIIGNIGVSTVIYHDAEIEVTSADGAFTKKIVVWSTGLVSVE